MDVVGSGLIVAVMVLAACSAPQVSVLPSQTGVAESPTPLASTSPTPQPTAAPTLIALADILSTPAGSASYDQLVSAIGAAFAASTYLRVDDPLWTQSGVLGYATQCASSPSSSSTAGTAAARAKGACATLVFHFYTDYRDAFSQATPDPGLMNLVDLARAAYGFATGPMGPYATKAELDDTLKQICPGC